jgi:hypothetical protein
VLASAAGSGLGWAVTMAVMLAPYQPPSSFAMAIGLPPFSPHGDLSLQVLVAGLVGSVLGGLAYGLITGPVLLRLLPVRLAEASGPGRQEPQP